MTSSSSDSFSGCRTLLISGSVCGAQVKGAGITPPPGLFFSQQTVIYKADTQAQIPLEDGSVGVNVEASPIVQIPTLVWVTPAKVLGGNLGFSATVPFGEMDIRADVGPLNVHDDIFTVGDPSIAGFMGWHADQWHIQVGVTAFLPIGDYKEGAIANVSKNRLAADVYTAITWFEPQSGIDFTNIVGVTLNAENDATNYKTGTEFHWEGSLTKKWTDNFSAGVIGYYYNQLSADSGSGATLGDFKGEIAAIGLTAGLDYVIGQTPVSSRIRYYHEFGAKNRLEGDSVFLSTSFPLHISR